MSTADRVAAVLTVAAILTLPFGAFFLAVAYLASIAALGIALLLLGMLCLVLAFAVANSEGEPVPAVDDSETPAQAPENERDGERPDALIADPLRRASSTGAVPARHARDVERILR